LLTDKTISGSSTERIVRGPKGSFIRKHQKPRSVQEKTDWVQIFTDKYCGGSEEEYQKVLSRFSRVNSRSSKQEANAIIAVYIEHGAKEAMLRDVFRIGYTRYEKILHNKVDKPSGGRNNVAVTDVMLAQLSRFAAHGVKTELGYPCGHRRQLRFVTDPGITSWEKLYQLHFLKFEADNILIRKMGYITFFNYMSAFHPEFRLKRVMEDACDTCIELKTMLKDGNFILPMPFLRAYMGTVLILLR
jgi:hypothetical protein